MNLETSVAVYLIVWWVVLFSILPVGVVSHAEAGLRPPGGGDPASAWLTTPTGSTLKSTTHQTIR